MKRLLSLFLSLALLFSSAPMVLTVRAEDAEPVPVLTTEEAPSERTEKYLSVPMTLSAAPLTAAAAGTVTVTVNAPSAGALKNVIVNLYSAVVTDPNGLVLSEADCIYQLPLEGGGNTVTFPYVKPGSYMLSVQSNDASGTACCGEFFYHADGTQAPGKFSARPFTVTSGKESALTVTLPAAGHTVSGRLVFPKALARDTSIAFDFAGDAGTYATLYIPAGATGADYCVGLPDGVYTMSVYATTYGTLDVHGQLSDYYSTSLYLNLTAGSVELADIAFDPEIGGTGSDPSEWREVRLSFSLPASDTARNYMVFAYATLTDIAFCETVTLDPGETEINASLRLATDMAYGFGFQPLAGGSYYFSLDNSPSYFFTGYGVSAEPEYGKRFDIPAGTSVLEISPDENDYYVLSGTVDRTSSGDLNKNIYFVLADGLFDGTLRETYSVPVLFEAGQTTADYALLLPTRQNGTEFTFSVRSAEYRLHNIYSNETVSATRELTVTGSGTVPTLELTPPAHTVSGTIAISGGTAPAGGLPVTLRAYAPTLSREVEIGTWIVPEGSASLSYSVPTNLTDWVSLEVFLPQNPHDYFAQTFSIDPDINGNYSAADCTIYPAVSIGGQLILPEEAVGDGATVMIYGTYQLGDSYNSFSGAFSVLPGERTGAWQLPVPAGCKLMDVQMDFRGGSPILLSSTLWSDGAGGSVSESTTLNLPVNAPVSGLDFRLRSGTPVPIRISLESGLNPAQYMGSLYVRDLETYMDYGSDFSFSGAECDTIVAVPGSGRYAVGIYLYNTGVPNVLSGSNLWYSDAGMVTRLDDATPIAVPAAAPVQLVLPKAETLTVRLTAPVSDHYFGAFELYQNGEYFSGTSFQFTGTEFTELLRVLPGESYSVAYVLHSYDGLSGESYSLYSTWFLYADGSMTTDITKAAAFTAEDTPVLTMQKQQSLSGTLTFAENATYSGTIQYGSSRKRFTFTGTSFDYSLPLSSTQNQPIAILLNDTTSALYTSGSLYFCTADGHAVLTDFFTDTFTFSADTVLNITVDPPRTISGRLVTEDGSTLTIPGPKQEILLRVQSEWDTYSVTGSLYPDGTWTAPLDGSYISAGDATLWLNIWPITDSNIVSGNYYYSGTDTVVSDSSDAATVTIPETGNLTGLVIPVQTGWLISGSILLPDGATFNPPDTIYSYGLPVSIQYSEYTGGYWYGDAELIVGERSAHYSIAIPRSETPLDLTVSRDFISLRGLIDTDLCFKTTEQKLLTGVDGDRSGVDFIVPRRKARISGTISLPESVPDESPDITVYADTDSFSYYGYAAWESATTLSYQIDIPETDASTTFRLNYALYGCDLLAEYGYLTADGTISTSYYDSADFPLAASVVKNFTLVETPPYLSGRIYIPAEAVKPFTVRIDGYAYAQETIEIDPASALTDKTGRKYVNYALRTGDRFGYYYPSVTVAEDANGIFVLHTSLYPTESGGMTETDYEARNCSLYEPFVWDIELPLEESVFESGHGLQPGEYTYTYRLPGTSTDTWVTFSDYTDVEVSINGSPCTGQFHTYDATDTLTFTFTAEDAGTFGFRITELQTYIVETPALATAAAVYTDNGSDAAIVLNDVQNGLPLRVCLVSDTYASEHTPEVRTVFAAAYDENGRFLGMTAQEITFTASGDRQSAELTLEHAEDASSVSVFLADEDFCPNMAAVKLH